MNPDYSKMAPILKPGEAPGIAIESICRLFDSQSGTYISGKLLYRELDQAQAFWRGARVGLRAVLTVVVILLPLAFMEPFVFLVVGGILLGLLLFVVGPIIHWRLSQETKVVEHVGADCVECGEERLFTPFVGAQLKDGLQVLCEKCQHPMRLFTTAE